MKLENLKEHIDGLYTCQRCGWCRSPVYRHKSIQRACPIYEYGNEGQWEHHVSRGRVAILRALVENEVNVDAELAKVFYRCTLCGNCREVCGSNVPFEYGYHERRNIDQVKLFEDFRADLVAAGFGPLAEHKSIIQSIQNYDNPWLQPRSARGRWTRALKQFKIRDLTKEKADVLFFVGCTASYDQNMKELAVASALLMHRAGVKFGILGEAEKCCGSTLLRLGLRPDFEQIAQKNIEQLNSLGVNTVVTSCSGCFKTMKEDYSSVRKANFELLHTTTYLNRLAKDGKIEFQNKGEVRVTYHDPCHLGRAAHVYDDPRELLSRIPGVKLIEMYPNREYSLCCGAGGGVRTGFPDLAMRIAGGKLKKIEPLNVDVLASACPFCEQNFMQAASEIGSQIKVMDVCALAAQHL